MKKPCCLKGNWHCKNRCEKGFDKICEDSEARNEIIEKTQNIETRITTAIIAAETSSETSAEITLQKDGPVNVILYCENFQNSLCEDWQETSIPFSQNATHIFFTVPHFTAYAGGWVNLHFFCELFIHIF